MAHMTQYPPSRHPKNPIMGQFRMNTNSHWGGFHLGSLLHAPYSNPTYLPTLCGLLPSHPFNFLPTYPSTSYLPTLQPTYPHTLPPSPSFSSSFYSSRLKLPWWIVLQAQALSHAMELLHAAWWLWSLEKLSHPLNKILEK